MYKTAIAFFLVFQFITAGLLLPLSDFSLMQDIPGMYQNYSHITTADELGAIDFIGDYLLHGKELLGHNEHDKPEGNNNSVQFQHQANPLTAVFLTNCFIIINLPLVEKNTCPVIIQQATSDYKKELFRPPLA